MKDTFCYRHMTTREIKPKGWLLKQLRIQADGLSGNLDKIWPDVRDSAWIGGPKGGWERVPYWLDGFVPLAYLLEDSDLQQRAQRYIDTIIANQKEDGWICPCGDGERARYDMWACFLICKALVVYEECSGDSRIEGVVYRALQNLQQHLRGNTLFNWAASRWFECLIPIYWLYDRVKEDWLIDLAVTLSVQGFDYHRLFELWHDQSPRREWSYQTHVVNLAMALKSGALFSRITGADAEQLPQTMFRLLTGHHGTATGHFTGDECLSGTSPIQGTELCGVVEALYSYEILAEVTGNPVWADRAEMLAFNALPAAISADMWTHQYDQMSNQIACVNMQEPPVFRTNSCESNLFGLEPNYGCCTANFNQAWPKYTLSAFLKKEHMLLSSALVPCEVTTEIDAKPVRITLDTLYPFGGDLLYTVECAQETAFTLGIRIPASAEKAIVDGKTVPAGKIHTIERRWHGTVQIRVRLEFACRLLPRPNGLSCLQRGPLVYAVPIRAKRRRLEYIRDGVERRFPYCDYELLPDSPWQYAFRDGPFTVRENGIGEFPFSVDHPPVTIEAPLAEIRWGTLENQPFVCRDTPEETVPLSMTTVELQPYGCTDLRMTELPVIGEGQ